MRFPNGAGFFPEYEDVPRNLSDEDEDFVVEPEGIDYDEYYKPLDEQTRPSQEELDAQIDNIINKNK
jgi:hypothetical protein